LTGATRFGRAFRIAEAKADEGFVGLVVIESPDGSLGPPGTLQFAVHVESRHAGRTSGLSRPFLSNRRKHMARKSKRKYSRSASSDVEKEMHDYKRGSARSGPGGKGGKVKSRKQAIAIGLSKARAAGKKVPRKRK
jgi:hypothetical protein